MDYNKDKLKKYFFEYDGEYSYDYYIDIIDSNHKDSPELIIEKTRVPGASRDSFYTEQNYENKEIDIECYIDVRHDLKRKEVHIKRIKQWLGRKYNYKKLRFSDDDGFYEGICISNMLFKEKVEGLYETLITFNCAPYKMKNKTYKVKAGEEIEVLNDGYFTTPLNIRMDFNNNTVNSFKIKILKDNIELKSFDCNAPASNVKFIKIDTDNMTVRSYTDENTYKSNVDIVTSREFLDLDIGKYTIKLETKATNSFVEISFNELEL